jgi:hypothetical protein
VLVKTGEIELDEAFENLVTALVTIMPGALTDNQMATRWERLYPYRGRRP